MVRCPSGPHKKVSVTKTSTSTESWSDPCGRRTGDFAQAAAPRHCEDAASCGGASTGPVRATPAASTTQPAHILSSPPVSPLHSVFPTSKSISSQHIPIKISDTPTEGTSPPSGNPHLPPPQGQGTAPFLSDVGPSTSKLTACNTVRNKSLFLINSSS